MDILTERFDKSTIEGYKNFLFNKIDIRTGELIYQGFTYNNRVFSMSENAQRNMLGIFAAKDSLPYPVSWNTKDDSETIQLVDATEVTNFFLTALAAKKAHQDSGTALKNQIRSAVDRAAIDAIIDNR